MNFAGLQVWGPDKGGREALAPRSRRPHGAEAANLRRLLTFSSNALRFRTGKRR